MRYITAFFMAWGNFLVIPCPCKLWDSRLNRLMLAFLPEIGALIGGTLVLLLLAAHEAGCRFDGWSEFFDRDTWARLLEEFPVDYRIYTQRERSYDEYLPWQHIDCRVSREYLMRENEKAQVAATTHDCREGCTGCGVNRYTVCTQGGSHV